MKKLKIALTVLFALSCTLLLFACGGKKKYISNADLSGQKTTFTEGTDFSTGDLKVTVYYQGENKPVELKPSEYEVDSSNYDKNRVGEVTIYVIPKNQPDGLLTDTADNRYKKEYIVTVEHNWVDKGDGRFECANPEHGAVRQTYTGLTTTIKTVGWGNPATLEQGEHGYPNAHEPVEGENHVALDTLVAGQSLKVTIKILATTRIDYGGTKIEAWDTPLMGIRNGGDGVLPREDSWVISVAAGYDVPEGGSPTNGGAPTGGTATTDSTPWVIYGKGETWSAATDYVGGTLVIDYVYDISGLFTLRHTLTTPSGATKEYSYTFMVPSASYECVAYGEYVNYQITDVDYVANREVSNFEVAHNPDHLVQPEGKMFDKTGLATRASFNEGDPVENSYNAYAYRDVQPLDENGAPATDEEGNVLPKVKTRFNLASEALTEDMYDFCVEFGGRTAWLTKNGEESTADNRDTNQLITVNATHVRGANATTVARGGQLFDAPEVSYDYAVSADNAGIELVAQGTAVKLTAEQKKALDNTTDTHFIAFKLLASRADDFNKIGTVAWDGGHVFAETEAGNGAYTNVNVIVTFTQKPTTFTLPLLREKTGDETADTVVANLGVNLNGLGELPTAGAEVTAHTFKIDQGGTYTVRYSGLNDIDNLVLATGLQTPKVSEVSAAITGSYVEGTTDMSNKDTLKGFFRASDTLYIVKVEKQGTDALDVTYWFAAPSLSSISSTDSLQSSVEIRNGDSTLARANIYFDLESSENAVTLGDGVHAIVYRDKLVLYKTFTGNSNINDADLTLNATVNIENALGTSYNVGAKVTDGVAKALDKNVLTLHTSTAIRALVLGNINDRDDYDRGAILIVSLHLPALNIRTTSETRGDVFHFTANEDTVNGGNAYTIYEATANTITKIEKTGLDESTRKNLQTETCVRDGINVFEYKYGDNKTFYYGAKNTLATGEHQFALDEGSTTMEHCSVCGYSREKFVPSEGSEVKVTLEKEGIALAINDTDGGDWWVNPTEAIELAGDFAIEFHWTNTDGNYAGNAGLEFFDADGNYFAMRTFVCDYNPGPDTSKLFLTNDTKPTHVYTLDGNPATDADLPAGGTALGEATVLVWRVMNNLYIRQTLVYGEHTLQVMSTFTQFTSGLVNLQLNGNTYWCSDVTYRPGYAEYTLDAGTGSFFTYELTDGFRTKHYSLPVLLPGAVLTVKGHHTSAVASNWNSLGYLLDTIYVRADNWVLGAASSVFSASADGNQYFTLCEGKDAQGVVAEDAFASIFGKVAKDCEYTLEISWEDSTKVVGTLTMKNAEGTFTDRIELEVQSIPAGGIPVQLSGEKVNYTVKTIEYVR